MSDKFIFQNARIKSMETKLLTTQHVQRFLDCDNSEELFKLLIEIGFGVRVGVDQSNFDSLFFAEEKNITDILREFNVDEALDCFLKINDYHNVKALFKASIMVNENPVLMPDGLIDSGLIKDAISSAEVRDLPIFMQEAISSLLKLELEEKITPHTIDTYCDRALYQDVFITTRRSEKITKQYFVQKIDFMNILSFLRCKKLKLDDKFYFEGFISGGELSQEFFMSVYESPLDALKQNCKFTRYQNIVTTYVDSLNLVNFEVEVDNQLLKMWKDNNNDMFSVSPIVSYYLTKQTEIKVVKLIVAGIKNNVSPEIIRERMRELYA